MALTLMEIEDILSIELPSAEIEKISEAFAERNAHRIMCLLKNNAARETGDAQWSRVEAMVKQMVQTIDEYPLDHMQQRPDY